MARPCLHLQCRRPHPVRPLECRCPTSGSTCPAIQAESKRSLHGRSVRSPQNTPRDSFLSSAARRAGSSSLLLLRAWLKSKNPLAGSSSGGGFNSCWSSLLFLAQRPPCARRRAHTRASTAALAAGNANFLAAVAVHETRLCPAPERVKVHLPGLRT